MNDSTYELLTQQLRDKDKRIDFLERLVEKNGQDSNPYRDDIDYPRQVVTSLSGWTKYVSTRRHALRSIGRATEIIRRLCSIYWNIV